MKLARSPKKAKLAPPARGMARLRAWWTTRNLVVKAAVAAAALLIGLPFLYVAVRSLQFAVAASEPIEKKLPDDGDFYVRFHDMSSNFWERWHRTEAWERLVDTLRRYPMIHDNLNATLRRRGLPTLEQLEDDRFLRREGRWFSRDRLQLLAGRDVAAMYREGEGGRPPEFLVASRLSYWMYLLTPFAGLAVGDGALQAGEQTLHLQFEGVYALVGSSAEVINRAKMRPYRRISGLKGIARTDRPVAETRLGSATSGAPTRRMIQAFPWGLLTYGLDLRQAEAVEIALDLDGAFAIADVAIAGAALAEPMPARPSPVDRAPASSALVLTSATSPMALWGWLRSCLPEEGQPAVGLVKTFEPVLRQIVDDGGEFGFEADVLAACDGPIQFAAGIENKEMLSAGAGQSVSYLAASLLVGSPTPGLAYDGLTRFMDRFLQERFNADPATVLMEEPGAAGRFRRPNPQASQTGERLFAVMEPAYGEMSDALVMGNSPLFVRRIQWSLPDRGFYRGDVWNDDALSKALATLDMARLFEDQPVAAGIAYFPWIWDGIQFYFQAWAYEMFENESTMTRVRMQLQATPEAIRQQRVLQGELFEEWLNGRVRREIDRLKRQTAEEFAQPFEWMQALTVAVARVDAGQAGVQARLVVGFRRPGH